MTKFISRSKIEYEKMHLSLANYPKFHFKLTYSSEFIESNTFSCRYLHQFFSLDFTDVQKNISDANIRFSKYSSFQFDRRFISNYVFQSVILDVCVTGNVFSGFADFGILFIKHNSICKYNFKQFYSHRNIFTQAPDGFLSYLLSDTNHPIFN